jgi:hypothetical protein
MRSSPRLAILLMTAAGVGACGTNNISLVDRLGDAERDFTAGRYPNFVQEPAERGRVVLDDDARDSLTPPFPAVLRFDLSLPHAAYLHLAPALVMKQRAARARVGFAVTVEADGERTTVFAETLRLVDANHWHQRRIDLTRWAGRRVTLELATRAPGGRADLNWTDRVQTVWGDPEVASSRREELVGTLKDLSARADRYLLANAEAMGVSLSEVIGTYRFAMNLLLGGILSIAIRELYRRYGSGRRPELGNLFPVLTLSSLLIIALVRVSLALSLGLIGALSIVRFRSAIRAPEEIAYLFFCVAVGVALGADEALLAATTSLLVGAFVVVWSRFGAGSGDGTFFLRVSGDAAHFFHPDQPSAVDSVRSSVKGFELQRLDRQGPRVEMRAVVTLDREEALSLPAKLRGVLPQLQFSYVSADEIS